ncbi:MAG: PQQ-binding-like beta-propeller repeat protein, partial [Kofleriaceae bacterium]
IAGGVVWAADTSGRLVALELFTGAPIWETELDTPVLAGLAIAGDRLVVASFDGSVRLLGPAVPLPPTPFLRYFEEDNRPQTRLDRDAGNGMGITIGRLREDPVFDWKFVALSHNTVRGAAGGAVLTAELLKHDGYLTAK